MKRKIALALLVVFACSACGAGIALLYIRATTRELGRIVEMHRVEDLRQHLIIAIQSAQSDLYTVRTSLGQRADAIVENLERLEIAAQQCAACHHPPAIAARIDRISALIDDYEVALSDYMVASADRDRITRLKLDAAVVGNELLRETEEMSIEAKARLEAETAAAMEGIGEAWMILFASLLGTLGVGVLAGIHLIVSVTRPIGALVRATRAVAAGDLGVQIPAGDRTEFGELATHFNAMTAALRDGYAALEAEVRDRRLAEEALRRSEERYALAARGANDGLWDWDLATGRVHFSPRWKAMIGHADAAIGDAPSEWLDRVHVADRDRVQAELDDHLAGRTPHFESEHRILCASGGYLWVMSRGLAVRDGTGKPCRIAGSQTDISARKEAEERLLHDAFHDALTGLANRALFVDRLEQVLRTAHRNRETTYAVLFLDLDRFKVVNDSLGHVIGDQLLVAVAGRLVRCLRPSDTIARLGGDEFAILLTDVESEADALSVVQRVRGELAESFRIEGHELFATASIGIALGSDRYERPEQILRDADVAMYQAKRQGRGHETFDVEMHGVVVERLALESELRIAVERGEQFLLHYQPIVDLRTGDVVGLEALIRWEQPRRGVVGPSEFIPLAEESGMILSIGDWSIRAACVQLRALRALHPSLARVRMSLNLSARQFRQPDFVERFAAILRETGVAPDQVALELTESAIMEDLSATGSKLQRLRGLGVEIHVDDFGTGYSSLSYLHRLPITAVKIDRSFVSGLGAKGESEEVIRAIVSLADSLGFEVIAEGVERPEQLERLRALGCRYAQGFYFSRPMAPEDLQPANAAIA
jgi:diguanylate cyclase (GGDEF)-like protein/PAS domain S-box-containing protein